MAGFFATRGGGTGTNPEVHAEMHLRRRTRASSTLSDENDLAADDVLSRCCGARLRPHHDRGAPDDGAAARRLLGHLDGGDRPGVRRDRRQPWPRPLNRAGSGRRGVPRGGQLRELGRRGQAVVEEIKGLGGDGVAVQADMSTTDGIKGLFKATADAFDDPVEVLVNNAGITRDTLAMRMKESQWTDVINTNLNG